MQSCPKRIWLGFVMAPVLVGAVGGCSTPPRPDLADVPRRRGLARQHAGHPHSGTLRFEAARPHDRCSVWPGAWNRILFNDYGDLELKFDPMTLEVERDDLEAFDLAEIVLGKDFYGPL